MIEVHRSSSAISGQVVPFRRCLSSFGPFRHREPKVAECLASFSTRRRRRRNEGDAVANFFREASLQSLSPPIIRFISSRSISRGEILRSYLGGLKQDFGIVHLWFSSFRYIYIGLDLNLEFLEIHSFLSISIIELWKVEREPFHSYFRSLLIF